MVAERLCGVKVDNITGNLRSSIIGAGAVDAGEGIGTNVRRVAGQHNAGTGGLDGHIPFVAGDVPVQLVMIFEEAQGIGDSVFNNEGPRNVRGVGDVDFQFAVVPLARAFVSQAVAGDRGDAFHVEEERVVHALRSNVLDGNFAVQATPGADEPHLDFFADVDDAIRRDADLGVESLDFEFARPCRGTAGEREQEKGAGQEPALRVGARLFHQCPE